MDVSQIHDTQALKALAYDQMVLREQIQRNLTLITERLAELEAQSSTAPISGEGTDKPTSD